MEEFDNLLLRVYILILGRFCVCQHEDVCDFETDLCGWDVLDVKFIYSENGVCRQNPPLCFAEDSKTYKKRWTREKGGNLEQLPTSYIHENNTVLYTTGYIPLSRAFPESDFDVDGRKILTSSLLSKHISVIHHPKCLQFFYLLQGDTYLDVSYVSSDQGISDSLPIENTDSFMLKKTYTHGKYLRKMSLDLPIIPLFKVVFQAKFYKERAGSRKSYAILDDIHISNGPCTEYCTPFQFHCLYSDECIDKNFICDNIPHCKDGTDEKTCINSEIHCDQVLKNGKEENKLKANISSTDKWLQNRMFILRNEDRRKSNSVEIIDSYLNGSSVRNTGIERLNNENVNVGADFISVNNVTGMGQNAINPHIRASFVNMVYSSRYGIEDFGWRHSKLCTFAGVLATVSSEASALFVSLMTIDRILAIKHPFANGRLQTARAVLLSILVWSVSLVLALFPLFLPLEDFYAQTAICIYLPLSVERESGWEYSMVVFVGFNFILFLGILVGQIFILIEVMKSGKKTPSTNTKRREISLAKSVGAIVLTDLLCWIPIGIIAMMTFSGVDVSQEVYIWITVLVLPINSALNPILYTLSALIRERNRRIQIRNSAS